MQISVELRSETDSGQREDVWSHKNHQLYKIYWHNFVNPWALAHTVISLISNEKKQARKTKLFISWMETFFSVNLFTETLLLNTVLARACPHHKFQKSIWTLTHSTWTTTLMSPGRVSQIGHRFFPVCFFGSRGQTYWISLGEKKNICCTITGDKDKQIV